jgi:hypothetical protein
MTPVITLTDRPDPNATAVIENGLAQFNREQTGYSDYRYLAVVVSDSDTKQVLGGILGRTSLGICFLDLIRRARVVSSWSKTSNEGAPR